MAGKFCRRAIVKWENIGPGSEVHFFYKTAVKKKWRESFTAPVQQKGLPIKHGRFFGVNRYKIKKSVKSVF
jgi:hypothetical protein